MSKPVFCTSCKRLVAGSEIVFTLHTGKCFTCYSTQEGDATNPQEPRHNDDNDQRESRDVLIDFV